MSTIIVMSAYGWIEIVRIDVQWIYCGRPLEWYKLPVGVHSMSVVLFNNGDAFLWMFIDHQWMPIEHIYHVHLDGHCRYSGISNGLLGFISFLDSSSSSLSRLGTE